VIKLSEREMKKIEEEFLLKRRGLEILSIIVAEWKSDPTSVQCFDLKIVEEAKGIVKQLGDLEGES
jgi:hypothetical protein